MHEQIETIKEIVLGVWAKKHYVIISTWLLCPIGWVGVSTLPDQYEASARVYVDTQSLLRPLMKGLMVETDPNTQIRLMIKTLLSRPNLERITRMTDLDLTAKDSEEFERLIIRLKDKIKIDSAGRENIYTLSISENDPQLAKNIVQAALSVFIENTLGETRSDTDTAQQFLQQQISEYEQRLILAEKRLTEFKQKYSGIMPDNSNGFYAALDNAKRLLKATNLQLLETQTRLSSAKSQLVKENSLKSQLSDNVIEQDSITTTYDDSIISLQANLDNLLISYTEKHPDVREMTRRLTELKSLRRKEIENYYANTDADTEGGSSTNKSQVYQAMKIQVNQLESEVASLRVRSQDYQNQVDELNTKIHILPEIEAELVGLNRDYDINKNKYEELLSRRETASLAKQADATSDKIQFRVIDPPRAPLEPTGPYRILLSLAVLVIGIGAGIGAAILMIQLNPKVISATQLNRSTNLPIFGVIAASENLHLRAIYKKQTRRFHLSNLMILLMMLAFIGYFLAPELIQPQLKRIF
ncbi:XrtA system polysaccharide chain length determinant [Thalassomonas sp. M1454]|uniref:XrtA system polysaccharide chain length determinant n=1 Tax=Thalassomonas sp. M1454 TaxID=2594477 RepID=UPI00117FBEC7|nr:XrtA system polysaccharide chain length determinant [Thalassomonas sp. M1454]TRX57951.1 chain length determinant family protein [Thalassomonas sp. M1454]